MAKKLPRRLVALSASAVAAVYFAGLLSTRAVADGATTVSAPTLASTPIATATSVASVAYADGTFSGTGSSRFGNVTVSVTTAAGRITNVQITRVTTSYPVSRIASLPAQVVQSQSATINSVSGATYSSQAFKQAVQAALSQALTANSAGVSTQ